MVIWFQQERLCAFLSQWLMYVQGRWCEIISFRGGNFSDNSERKWYCRNNPIKTTFPKYYVKNIYINYNISIIKKIYLYYTYWQYTFILLVVTLIWQFPYTVDLWIDDKVSVIYHKLLNTLFTECDFIFVNF